ncbi:rhodanese-like domain-containing protein [Eubacterium pyruvativorans]|uniref:rhodanese-like domain-containing protein n=1 Tax=Eubacterium pyruvativorans TaxID=155865 RepID=UPI0023F3ACF1|nr:rhodanese-like domain-containing protein [Eubacterium pyruvativorans]MDD7684365.1 rhodanese-like domain-containing protein [Eubacterium pyruvativorans]
MKRKGIILALVVSVVLCFSGFQSVFADTFSEKPNEKRVEDVTYNFINEWKDGGYELVDTDTLHSWVEKKEKMIIIDTMPAASYNEKHVPGAINSLAPLPKDKYTDKAKADLLGQVNKLLPSKKVTTLKKVSKAAYSKLAKKNRVVKTVKGKKVYYKKTVKTVKDKGYKIVVYCGHVGCGRSHVAAKYLVQKGFTNVYRYGGGISAWVDAGYPVESVQA